MNYRVSSSRVIGAGLCRCWKRGRALAVLALLLAGPAVADNLLVNGEFDGGDYDTPPGWTETLGSDCGSPDHGASQADGYCSLWAAGCLDGPDPGYSSVVVSQTATAPVSGYYRVSVAASLSYTWPPDDCMYASEMVVRVAGFEFTCWPEPGLDFCGFEGAGPPIWLEAGVEFEVSMSCRSHDLLYWSDDCSGEMAVDFIRIEWDEGIAVRPTSWSTVKALY